ncbi:DUF3054 domain-containing protein [Tessaracoccus sp. OS52]|uniref:DUF3054 domain-containing protein n=1 Tax=Tessaracoccus sp. OS52 TaxID=2886691 RepID=UPI001D129BC0|nr:DUF3054 domain-containing protein [Tessaracoccus sp. OS52]MCC2592948.1 DUF3054 domain-containing protein [Tessaracoccus sp. OS52]
MMRIVPAAIDLFLVLVFAVIGRATHANGLSFLGILETAWPFLLACLFGWVVLNLLDDDGFGLRAALVVWLVTVLGGMGLRIVVGGGAAMAFVVVATLVLAAFLFGWRLGYRLLKGRSQSSDASNPGMLAGRGPE